MLARTIRAGVAAVCTLGVGLACLGSLSGCAPALAGNDARVVDPAASASDSQDGMALSDGSEASLASSLDGLSSSGSASADDSADAGASADVSYNDGTYYATGRGGKFGGVPVTVIIKQGSIVSVTLRANSETDAMAEKARSVVVPQIIESQGVEDIDAATGATLTSNAIVDGVAQALARAAR